MLDKCKGETDMLNNILDERNCVVKEWAKVIGAKIREYFDEKEKDILKKDIVNNEIESFKKDLLELLKDNGIDYKDVSISISGNDNREESVWEDEIKCTYDTELTLKKNKDLNNQGLDNLNKYCNEIHSVLSMCESFENIISVLRDYGVIESDSLKVNHDFDFMKFVPNNSDNKD